MAHYEHYGDSLVSDERQSESIMKDNNSENTNIANIISFSKIGDLTENEAPSVFDYQINNVEQTEI
jgi:hypothetical protein